MKKIFFLLVGMVAGLGASEAERYLPVYIAKAVNLTRNEYTLHDYQVAPGHSVMLDKPLLVPFVSLSEYAAKYAWKKPYTPKKALKITTAAGEFRLWMSESGVMFAPYHKNADQETWNATSLLDAVKAQGNQQKLFVRLLLTAASKARLQRS